jgi:serine/threonine protein phosphatase 1
MRILKQFFTGTLSTAKVAQHLRLEQWPGPIYAIGDIHGCLDALLDLEKQIHTDAEQFDGPKLMVLLGDYVDRGPKSSGVLRHLLGIPEGDFTRIALAGNHESMMLSALEGTDIGHWLSLGGTETLRSYGIDHEQFARARARKRREILSSHIPNDHLNFLRELPLSLQVLQTVFVHAGIRRHIPMDEQDARDLLWMRHDLTVAEPDDGLLVVHGHTPVEEVQIFPGRIAIDTGAFATGRLTAIRLTADLLPKIFTSTSWTVC